MPNRTISTIKLDTPIRLHFKILLFVIVFIFLTNEDFKLIKVYSNDHFESLNDHYKTSDLYAFGVLPTLFLKAVLKLEILLKPTSIAIEEMVRCIKSGFCNRD